MPDSLDEVLAKAAHRHEMCAQVKEMIVDRLDLPIEPAWVTDDQPLIARGLELDSVDVLELIIGIEAAFGASITDDEIGALGSVSRVVDRIEFGGPLPVPEYGQAL
jgi:acyl carrier protein